MRTKRTDLVSNHTLVLIVSEMAILVFAAFFGTSIYSYFGFARLGTGFSYLIYVILFAVLMPLCMGMLGMYRRENRASTKRLFLRLISAAALASFMMVLLITGIPALQFDEKALMVASMFSFGGVTISRTFFSRSISDNSIRKRLLFLGSGSGAKECLDLISQSNLSKKFDVIGFISLPGEAPKIMPIELLLLDEQCLHDVVERFNAEELVVAVDNRRGGKFPIAQLLQCKLNGIKVTESTAFFERELCQIRLDSLQPSWLVFGHGFNQSKFRVVCKRTVDIVMSMLLCLLTWPLLLVTAAAIVIEDGGPVFYRQERVGLGGKTFMVLKFRSMRKDAESAGAPQWASTNDDRATFVGRLIRKFRIDEIPQIINVLDGEMSFVGPRPERPFFVQQLIKDIQFYDVRHSIKPGITGMAQVRYQYGASVEDAIQKLQYDLYYVKNNSLIVDAMILFETLHVVIFGKGAR